MLHSRPVAPKRACDDTTGSAVSPVRCHPYHGSARFGRSARHCQSVPCRAAHSALGHELIRIFAGIEVAFCETMTLIKYTLLVAIGWLAMGCTSTVEVDAAADDGDQKASASDQVEQIACPSSGSCQSSSCDGGRAGGQRCKSDWQCSLDEPCDTVNFVRDNQDGSISLDSPNAAQCVLQALRDGKQGTVQWYISSNSNPGQYFTSGTVHVRPNRVALESVHTGADLLQNKKERGPTVLQDPSYFEDCLLQTAPEDIYNCLENAVHDCTP
jgi:hypothetical protein